jgi:acetyl esterase/lipase
MTDTDMNRRALLGSAIVTGLAGSLIAAQASAQVPGQTFPKADATLTGTPEAPVVIPAPPEPAGLLSQEVVELWPAGHVPGSEGVTANRMVLERGSPAKHDRAVMHVSRPILEVFRPQKPNGAAMVILPGGGYVRLAVDKEGAGGAHRLTQDGITCFVLNYRLPGDKWAAGYDAPLQDVQRAVRLIRANAGKYGVDAKRVGVMGFSAGGHLAAASLTRHDATVYAPVDAADQQSARPDVVMLGYAVMTVSSKDFPVSAETAKPLDQRARKGLPPTFILHAANDPTVPILNSLTMFQALKTAEVPVELHVYQEGGHGFGFSLPPELPASHWPDAFVAWLKRGAFI